MESPEKPLVIVEGKFDAMHLRHAIRGLGIRPLWRLIALEEVDNVTKAGGDALLQYLKVNQLVLASRPAAAPVIVLRDWEDEPKIQSQLGAVRAHEYSTVLACPEDLGNPELGSSFRGIERYLSTETIKTIAPPGSLGRPAESEYPLSISKNALDGAKKRFCDAATGSATSSPYMQNLAKWLDHQVGIVLSGVPVDSFLL